MRYIFLMVMFASMLFSSAARQIVVGSFSVESNALFYSLDVQKQVDEDNELNKLMDKYSLKLEYKQVGTYYVVRIAPFNDYPSLFETIDKVKKHFPEAYAINYPAFASALAKPVVVSQEAVVEEEPEPLLQPEPEEIKVEAVKPEAAKPVAVEKEIKYEPQKVQRPAPMPLPKAAASASALSFDDMLLLVLLLIAIIGFVVYKKKMKKEEE